MKKKVIVIITIVVLLIVMAAIVAPIFYSQYNTRGISHFMIVSEAPEQEKALIGYVSESPVYVEGFDPNELYFVTANSNKILVKEALSKKWVKPIDWEKHAYSVTQNGDTKILLFDDYEIAVTGNEYLVRPKSTQ